MRQPFVNAQFARDVIRIQNEGKWPAIQLAVLAHIMARRRWQAPGKGWADLPIRWFATTHHVGYNSVREAIDQLVAWKLLTPGDANGTRGIPLRFRYDLRGTKEEAADEMGWDVEKQKKLKRGPDGMYGEGWVFDPVTYALKQVEVSAADYLSWPTCATCGKVFHPTEGRGRKEDECADCAITALIKESYDASTNKPVTIKSAYGKHEFTALACKKRLQA